MNEEVHHMDEITVYRYLMNTLRGKIAENQLVIKEAEYENEVYEKVLRNLRNHTKQIQKNNGGSIT